MALRDKDRTKLNYAAAIGVSALAHAGFLYLVLFALPQWLTADQTPPPAYTVAIVDNLPAGNLGTHLPPLAGKPHRKSAKIHQPPQEQPPEPAEKQAPPKASTPAEAPNTDLKALALNNVTATAEATPETTPTPTPPVVETPEPTVAPTQAPTQQPTAKPTRRPRPTARPRPTPRPHPEARKHNRQLKPPAPKAKPKVMLARTQPTPKPLRALTVKERLAILHKELEQENRREQAVKMAKAKAQAETDTDTDEESGDDSEDGGASATTQAKAGSGGGPVAGNSVTNGRGYGVGPGSGSVGILKDPEFLLYYQKVQERIKDAWSYAGGNKDLTTTVNFAIGPDGKLTSLEVAQSSNNASFDQSVLRAIRRAAPFPPPPEHYRDQFGQGVQAVFELGELRS